MPRVDIVGRLAAIAGRGACTDAERRASALLRDELRAGGRAARMEPYWVRPQWAWSWALHAFLGVAGSLLAVAQPAVALGIVALTLVSYVLDVTGRAYLLRSLFPRRATQLVVSAAPTSSSPVRLVVTASVDAPRTGAAFGDAYVRAEARARRALGGHLSSPPAFVAFLLLVCAGLAGARLAGAGGQVLGVAQLVPTVGLLLAVGVLVDIALSSPSPGANADASGVAAALAIADALDDAPPRNLDVEVVLAGAGDGRQLGMHAYVEERRHALRAEQVVVLALGPCGGGQPRYHVTEGLLFPLRLHPRLVMLAERVAATEQHLRAGPARRGLTGAQAARRRRWPALGVVCLDEHDRPPRARRAEDTADRVDAKAVQAAVELCLGVVGRLDKDLSAAQPTSKAALGGR